LLDGVVHVFRKFLSLGVLLIAAVGAATGQSPPDVSLPEPCRAGITQDLPTLEKRKQQLERENSRSFRTKTFRKRQEELLRALFQIECLKAREREQVVEVLPAGEAALRSEEKPRHIVEVTTYHATTRRGPHMVASGQHGDIGSSSRHRSVAPRQLDPEQR
jgi:hypothetical protein